VLRAGEIVEYGEAASIFEKPEMEYTRNLLEASDIK
jgi:ABC-type microcin C transport system duplicated ATPase subunit YejF